MKEIKKILELVLYYILTLALFCGMSWLAFGTNFWIGLFWSLFIFSIAFLILSKITIETFSPTLAERRKRKARAKKIIPKVVQPIQIKEKRKTKKEGVEKREILSEAEKISVKGEVMRELCLSYNEKIKRKEEPREIILASPKSDENLLVRKQVAYLEKIGLFNQLIEKGEFYCSSDFHLGGLRGADIAVKLIKPTLKELGIDFQIKFNEREARISLDKKARVKLKDILKGQI